MIRLLNSITIDAYVFFVFWLLVDTITKSLTINFLIWCALLIIFNYFVLIVPSDKYFLKFSITSRLALKRIEDEKENK